MQNNRKPQRRQKCSREDCTKSGYIVNPFNTDFMLCTEHFDELTATVKQKSALHPVDKHRIITAQKIQGDYLSQVIHNRELSFTEKINLLNL